MVEPARDWPRFLGQAEVNEALGSYDVLEKMYDPETGMTPECGAQFAALDRSIRVAPVGIALWRAGEVCARLVKDAGATAFYGEGVSRLAAFALAKDSVGPWNPPIRVLRIDDITALVEATGFESLYVYEDRGRSPEHMVIVHALWDEESKRERHLGFDFLDTIFRLKNPERLAGYPAYKVAMRKSFEAAMSAGEDEFGKDVLAASSVRGKPASTAVASLRAPAVAGGLSSLRSWLGYCHYQPYDGCADGLVDALLPLAEQQLAMYNVQLAVAYARGLGVKKDLDAALTLVDAAERRWGGGNALAQFAEQLGFDQPLPAQLMERLARAATAGGGRAGMARLNSLTSGQKGNKLSGAALAAALSLAEQGFADARIAAYRHFREVGEVPRAMAYLRAAAESGHADGMERYATELMLGEHVPRDLPAGRALMLKAANAADWAAMEFVGDEAFRAKRWAEAEAWYASGASDGDDDAVAGLLRVYEEQRPGLAKGPADALAIYEGIAAISEPRYRRMYADFLLHKAQKRNPAKARELLEGDAAKGDRQSKFALARAMILGEFGKPDVAAGFEMIEKAMAEDESGEVADALAYFLYYKQRTPEARKRALDIERALAKRNYPPGLNNLAWWLCTSADKSVHAPAEGLEVARKLGDPDKLGISALDTVAACHAAVGQFDRAIELETKVLHTSARYPLSVEDGEVERRLQGFREGRPYIEPAEHTGD